MQGLNCTFNGKLIQGTEYVNGQYTYRYMQEYTENSNWKNIKQKGWGVILTDNGSINPVTTKLCTYINGRPVVSMAYMFADSVSKEIDLSSFNTTNVIDMKGMFYNSAVTSLDLSSFDTSNVTNMSGMFRNSSVKTLDLSSFDTSNVTVMNHMFNSSAVSSIDLSS